MALALLCFIGKAETQSQRELSASEAVFQNLLEMSDVSRFDQGRGVGISNDGDRCSVKFLRRFRPKYPGLALIAKIDMNTKPDPNADKCEVVLSVREVYWYNSNTVYVDGTY